MQHLDSRRVRILAQLACLAVGFALTLTGFSQRSLAVVYLTGSVSASTANAGLQTHESTGGSGSIAFDLGSFIRLGFTHKQQFQVSEGLVGTSDDDDIECLPPDMSNCADFSSRTHITSNSIDLTLILYEGDVVVPFIMGGAVVKSYDFETTKTYDPAAGRVDENDQTKATVGPLPNLGAGVGIRLNKQFQLKFTYTASPGVSKDRNGEEKSVWDRDTTVGLTYQL